MTRTGRRLPDAAGLKRARLSPRNLPWLVLAEGTALPSRYRWLGRPDRYSAVAAADGNPCSPGFPRKLFPGDGGSGVKTEKTPDAKVRRGNGWTDGPPVPRWIGVSAHLRRSGQGCCQVTTPSTLRS